MRLQIRKVYKDLTIRLKIMLRKIVSYVENLIYGGKLEKRIKRSDKIESLRNYIAKNNLEELARDSTHPIVFDCPEARGLDDETLESLGIMGCGNNFSYFSNPRQKAIAAIDRYLLR